MTRETEELLAEVLAELLHELRALRQERERDERDYQTQLAVARYGRTSPPRRPRGRWSR
jgi:hypothetical protein